MGPRDRRFFSSDSDTTELARAEGVASSPGRDAEVELVKGPLKLSIFHLELKTRHYSGRDGVLVDVSTIERSWIAGDERLFEEIFNAIYCVVRESDGRFHIVRVRADLWPVPLANL